MAEVKDNSSIQLFEDQKIRTAWDAEKEEWYFSIVDVVAVLTEQKDSRSAAKYWSVLKVRLKNEGSELTTNRTVENEGSRWKTSSYGCCQYGAAFTHHSVDSFQKG